nr:hypothetical protein [uncultured bacterium]
MQAQRTHCSYCKVVNTVCFWGPRPEATWKRPVLILCALPFAFGIPALLWHFWGRPDSALLWLLGIPLFLLAILGLLVGASGCSACVSRLFGEL